MADDARSLVAAALLAHRSKGRGAGRLGQPGRRRPRPGGRRVPGRLGVDLGSVVTVPPSLDLLDGAELVVVGYDQDDLAGGRRSEDWCIDDPRGKDAEAVRCIRDAIDRRVQRLLIRMGVALPARPR